VAVIVIVADGARPDVLERHMNSGVLPALDALRSEGGLHTVTTCAPSVTGPAYTPFLMGRYPAPVGLPGLRWFDRSRATCRLPGHSRSYVGPELSKVDGDLAAGAATIFELAPSSLGALSVITRGLTADRRIGYGVRAALRTGFTHLRGDVRGWLKLDRRTARQIAERTGRQKPEYVFAALTGIDKTSHARGQGSPVATEAFRIVDELVAELRALLERAGTWNETHLWVVSDHGHVDLRRHDDLARVIAEWGYPTRAHPWAYTNSGEIAVMVSGNAMAHLYVDLESRTRRWWQALAPKFEPFAQQLLARDSVDLLILPHSPTLSEIRSRARGTAMLDTSDGSYSYRPRTGDPLGLGELNGISGDDSYDATLRSDYPDALVQIAALCAAPRAGDVMISATRDWDFRARYEPIPHTSSHGALHRDHMLVPLLTNRPLPEAPRRTVDVFPSTLDALGIPHPSALDGRSFLRGHSAANR
jgi:hypothetical protein